MLDVYIYIHMCVYTHVHLLGEMCALFLYQLDRAFKKTECLVQLLWCPLSMFQTEDVLSLRWEARLLIAILYLSFGIRNEVIKFTLFDF